MLRISSSPAKASMAATINSTDILFMSLLKSGREPLVTSLQRADMGSCEILVRFVRRQHSTHMSHGVSY